MGNNLNQIARQVNAG
ncbi:plasmid mobilization relaxosome protein MobC, partial [Escherichia coli]